MTRILKDITLILGALVSLIMALLVTHHDVSFLTITSQSMSPTFKAGDVVVTRQITIDTIKRNDILVLPLPTNKNVFFAHRVVYKELQENRLLIQTKGDLNQAKDEWLLEITSKEVPKVMSVVSLNRLIAGPIGRRTLFLSLMTAGAALLLFGSWRALRLALS